MLTNFTPNFSLFRGVLQEFNIQTNIQMKDNILPIIGYYGEFIKAAAAVTCGCRKKSG